MCVCVFVSVCARVFVHSYMVAHFAPLYGAGVGTITHLNSEFEWCTLMQLNGHAAVGLWPQRNQNTKQ